MSPETFEKMRLYHNGFEINGIFSIFEHKPLGIKSLDLSSFSLSTKSKLHCHECYKVRLFLFTCLLDSYCRGIFDLSLKDAVQSSKIYLHRIHSDARNR